MILRLILLLFVILAPIRAGAQHTTKPLQLTYAVVEVTPGANPSVSITIAKGLPPANGAAHMYGVPTVNFVRYDSDPDTGASSLPGNLHLLRYYVLGVPAQLRISDLVAGTVTSISLGDPPLVLPGQSNSCGILFPDAHFVGCFGDSNSGWLISATMGQYQKFAGADTAYAVGYNETSIGLMPHGNAYVPYASPNLRGHPGYSSWFDPNNGPQTAAIYFTYLYSSPQKSAGGRAGTVLLRYVVGY